MKRYIESSIDPELNVTYDEDVTTIDREDFEYLGIASSKISTATLEFELSNCNLTVNDKEYQTESINEEIEDFMPLIDDNYLADDFYEFPTVTIDKALEDLWFYDDGILSVLPEKDGDYSVSLKGSITYECVIDRYTSGWTDIHVKTRPTFEFKDIKVSNKITETEDIEASTEIVSYGDIASIIESENTRAKDSIENHYAICYAVSKQLKSDRNNIEFTVILNPDSFVFVADSKEDYEDKVDQFCNGQPSNIFEFYTFYNR